ncbi:glycogen synthase [Actinacidiphila acididurans]|uniref:D-inositol 3-phosphate glycosyltransferase n=1 Tax=Actinacidiphila acididurans TaxID=2784346 RepID=A0ABS2TZT2_9ACTN|nr:glycogen synthase [Actinacidiphila acididurans]MBM9507473.1 glycogen synthase [Actinacidiphila acididurans]
MRVELLTREYPPHVYGGAGVHVTELAAALRDRIGPAGPGAAGGPGGPGGLADVTVRCFGPPRPEPWVVGYPEPALDLGMALRTLAVAERIAADAGAADVVHSHTWYANAAGHLAQLAHGVRHVVTTHSLEPLRPWKAEQLGTGYAVSRWIERSAVEAADAVIAVSEAMRRDVLAVYPRVRAERVHVIGSGIDTESFRPQPGTEALVAAGVDPARPYVLFVGRVTRQKGLAHLLAAAEQLLPGTQLVLVLGAADTPRIAAETDRAIADLAASPVTVVPIRRFVDRRSLCQLLTHAVAFVCPSLYEPQGIVNLEAMACGTAVVATAVGGIPDVVVDKETGLLVPFAAGDDATGEPRDPTALAGRLAESLNTLIDDRDLARELGTAGRERAVAEFSWKEIAGRVTEVYASL